MTSKGGTPMTSEAASRIQSAEAKQGGGRVEAGGFASRAQVGRQGRGVWPAAPAQQDGTAGKPAGCYYQVTSVLGLGRRLGSRPAG